MKYINTLGFLILSMMVYSQTSLFKKHAVFYMPTEPKFLTIKNFQKFISTENTNLFLESNYLNNRFSGQKLELESIKKSPLGFHHRYKHIYKGLPVFQSFVQANYDNLGNLVLVMDNLAQFDDLDIPEIPNTKGKFWMNTNYGLTPAYRMEIWDSSKNQSAQFYFNNEDKLLFVNDPRLYFNGPDSMVSAMVYLPNPIVAANATYGDKGFVDDGDKNTTELTDARIKVRVPLMFNNGKFILSNGLITLKNLHDPLGNPIEPTDTFLNFTRDQSGFEDINVFYHLNNYSQYLRTIGFESLLDSLYIDAHGSNGDDNSFFDPQKYPYEIEYGTGGVDDGEDGQVIIHEFGHSLSIVASPTTVQGTQRLAMEEGQADYVCMSYSGALSINRRNDVFSWDGHNQFWNGFKTNTKGLYKNLSGIKDIDRELWSTALMCINDKFRRTKSDSLILTSFFLQASQGTMPQMARVILKIDSILFQGKDVANIWQCFTDRGILDTVPWSLVKIDHVNYTNGVKILNTSNFAIGADPAVIKLAYPILWKQIEIYNSKGQIIKTLDSNTEITLFPELFQKGVYYIRLNSFDGKYSINTKLLRFY
jgi:hypothetical protein